MSQFSSGVSLEEFKQLYVDITEAIREVDNNHLIWIEGNWYGTDFALTPPWDDNMGYSSIILGANRYFNNSVLHQFEK